MRLTMYGAGMAIVLASIASPLVAGSPVSVPEIDGRSIATGLGLLAGGLLMLRARWRRK